MIHHHVFVIDQRNLFMLFVSHQSTYSEETPIYWYIGQIVLHEAKMYSLLLIYKYHELNYTNMTLVKHQLICEIYIVYI